MEEHRGRVCDIDFETSYICSALNLHTVRLFTDSDDTRGCSDTICPPKDEQGDGRNMLRIVV